jgi:hypothetical protein
MPSKPWSSNFWSSRFSLRLPSGWMGKAHTLRCTLSFTYRVLPSGLTSMPLVVPMSFATSDALPSLPMRQTWPVLLPQFGSLA